MTAEKREIQLTARCAPSAEPGQILFPNDDPPVAKRVLVESGPSSRLMKVGLRSDPGTAACVPATTLAAMGGDGAKVRYRDVTFLDVLRRDRGLLLQFSISLLTLVATVLAAWGVYVKSGDAGPGSWARETAIWVLVIAFALAALKFYKDYRDL